MKPEKQNLIHDLLEEEHDARREATLRAGGRILRHRRWRRMTVRSFAAVAIVGIAVLSHQQRVAPRPPVVAAIPAPPPVPAHELTDDELLALFPKTPVALATLENGKKRLIFPRPGDEARFITRL